MGLVAQNLWNSVERGCNKSGHIWGDALEPFHRSEMARILYLWPFLALFGTFWPLNGSKWLAQEGPALALDPGQPK